MKEKKTIKQNTPKSDNVKRVGGQDNARRSPTTIHSSKKVSPKTEKSNKKNPDTNGPRPGFEHHKRCK